jgi:hypothetical protein
VNGFDLADKAAGCLVFGVILVFAIGVFAGWALFS